MSRNINEEVYRRQKFQNTVNSKTPKELKEDLQLELKKLNSALICNSDQHIKRHSEHVVIINRKLQNKTK